MVLFIESKPQDIVETEMQSLSLNSIIKPRSLINQRFLGFVLAKCLQFEENATNKQVRSR